MVWETIAVPLKTERQETYANSLAVPPEDNASSNGRHQPQHKQDTGHPIFDGVNPNQQSRDEYPGPRSLKLCSAGPVFHLVLLLNTSLPLTKVRITLMSRMSSSGQVRMFRSSSIRSASFPFSREPVSFSRNMSLALFMV